MRPETKLARVFTELVDGGKRLDTVAGGILAIVAEAKVRSVEQFNPLVSAAYDANGWNPRPGRPTAETKGKEEVPGTVRTYVTTIRRAFRRGIDVSRMRTFYELRQAIRKTKAVRRPLAGLRGLDKAVKDDFAGVSMEAVDDLNGALVHDIGVVYARLPDEHRTLFERQLQQLMTRYLPLVKGVEVVEQQVQEAALAA